MFSLGFVLSAMEWKSADIPYRNCKVTSQSSVCPSPILICIRFYEVSDKVTLVFTLIDLSKWAHKEKEDNAVKLQREQTLGSDSHEPESQICQMLASAPEKVNSQSCISPSITLMPSS